MTQPLWSLAETQAVMDMFNATHSPLRDAIGKLFAAKRDEMRANCSNSMASVPRQIERASDFASKAEAYGSVLYDLEAEVERQLLALKG